MSKSVSIVRAIIKLNGEHCTVFNDRTKVGRSIKVWGWKRADYERALHEIQSQGITAQLVTTPVSTYNQNVGGSLRIHTVEAE